MSDTIIPSVNFHLWEPCNMRCKYCFASFNDVKQQVLPKGHLPKEQTLTVVEELARFGFEKITFAGGEPTLCPWLGELIAKAKSLGMTTMIVTNGSCLTTDFLTENKSHLDWVSISMDSINEERNIEIGRSLKRKKQPVLDYSKIIEEVKQFGYRLKLNTVVHRQNYMEDFSDFIRDANPERWKVLQVLPISGQNDRYIDDFTISETQFKVFVERHSALEQCVPENNSDMTNSYVMIDPSGRFFTNQTGTHVYSKPILEVGITTAFSAMGYNLDKFKERGGVYDWV